MPRPPIFRGKLSAYLCLAYFCILLTLITTGCAPKVPMEPPMNSGTVFQYSLPEVQDAARNTLARLNFAIVKEDDSYIEAVHLKEGETATHNSGELVGIWFKPRASSVIVLVRTQLRASGIASQRDWDEAVITGMMRSF